MASILHSDVYDNGLSVLAAATVLHICSSQPTSFAQVATYSLGSKASPSVGAITTRGDGGRQRVIAAFTDGVVSASGTAAYFALVDGTRILATNDLATARAMVAGDAFSLEAITIGLPAPSD